jgi:hypothetical protein
MERVKMEISIDNSKIITVHGRNVKQTKAKLERNMHLKGLIE